MNCQDCGSNEAFVHLSEVVEGDVRSIWLCSSCSLRRQNRKAPDYPDESRAKNESDNLASFLGDDFSHPESGNTDKLAKICPACDYAFSQWKESKLLGCSQCYTAFNRVLLPHLTRYHGNASHFGKIPRRRQGVDDRLINIKRVRVQMEKAISSEDFEEAARLRDLLAKLKSGVEDSS